MRPMYNSLTTENMSLRRDKNGFLYVNDKKYLNMKQAALFVGRSFKTVSAWALNGSKTGLLTTLMLFSTKWIAEDDLISYKAHLRGYRTKAK